MTEPERKYFLLDSRTPEALATSVGEHQFQRRIGLRIVVQPIYNVRGVSLVHGTESIPLGTLHQFQDMIGVKWGLGQIRDIQLFGIGVLWLWINVANVAESFFDGVKHAAYHSPA